MSIASRIWEWIRGAVLRRTAGQHANGRREADEPTTLEAPEPAQTLADEADPLPQDEPVSDETLADDPDPLPQEEPPLDQVSAADTDPPPQEAPVPDKTLPDDSDPLPQEEPPLDQVSAADTDPPPQEAPVSDEAVAGGSDALPQEDLSPDQVPADDSASPSQEAPVSDETPTPGPDSPPRDAPATDERSVDAEPDAPKRERRPREIPGRRSPSSRPVEPSEPRSAKTFVPKAELVCREPAGSWRWEVLLTVPEERGVECVRHDGVELSAENGEYRLPSFPGNLVVEYTDGTRDEMPLGGDDPLIFKLPNGWRGYGRKTPGITRGHFIVFAPGGWTRTGTPPLEPANCVDANYTAHYFFVEPDDETTSVGGFEECDVHLAKAGFALDGKRLYDDSGDGDLFVDDVPTLEPAPGIVWVRVGEEARDGWKGESSRLAERTLGDVLGGRQGRFFVRVYDESVDLVDSGDFRYCAELREIRVDGRPYSPDTLMTPSSDGHSPTTLQFVAADGQALQHVPKAAQPHVTMAADGVATIAPHPDADETTWTLGAGSGPDVVIRLPRIWWRPVARDSGPGDWQDRALDMSRDQFREQSYADAAIEVRVPASVKAVSAGFELPGQSFGADNAEGGLRRATLPLNAFVDYEEIDAPSAETIVLKARCGDFEVGIIHVLPDTPVPEPVSPQTEADDMSDGKPPVESPSAYAQRPDGSLRRGRGFSRRELEAAGLTTGAAARLSIPTDVRRRTAHRANIEALEEVKCNA